jgi:hypothetical protein
MVPLQVMSICNDRNSFTGAQRGMLVAVEASFARAQGLESVLFMLLPDQDPNITIGLDPAFHKLERYSFLNTVPQPNRVLAPHWNNYYALSQLCPAFVPPTRPAYSYVTPARTCVTGLGITYATAISGMFFGIGYALAFDDPWFPYYYEYPGLMFYPGYGYYDPTLYAIGLEGELLLAEAALLGSVAAGLGLAIGIGLVAGLELAIFAEAWCDPLVVYAGPGLMIVEPGCFVYGGGGLIFEGGFGGYVGVDGGFAVAAYNGDFIAGDGYVAAPYVDNGMLPDPGAVYGEAGGTGYDPSTGMVDPSAGAGYPGQAGGAVDQSGGSFLPSGGGQTYVPDAGPGGTGYDPNAAQVNQQYVPDAGAGGTGDQTDYAADQQDYTADQTDYTDAGPGGDGS